MLETRGQISIVPIYGSNAEIDSAVGQFVDELNGPGGQCCRGKAVHSSFLKHSMLEEAVVTFSAVSIALVLLIGATLVGLAEEGANQAFTCTAKTFNECLMEAPCGAWKRSGPKEYKLDSKIIYRGKPVEGETISGGKIGEILETKCRNK